MESLPLSSFPVVGVRAICQAVPLVIGQYVDGAIAQSTPRDASSTTKIAENQSEREAALRMVHDVYVRSGLTAPHPCGLRVMRHHLSEHTDVLIVKRGGSVVMTNTLVRDAADGLPLDSLFKTEVDAMRAQGIRMAEVSCLASDHDLQHTTQRFETLVELISLTFQISRYRGIDRLLLAVHPKHARTYQRLFGCVTCSDVRQYAAVCGNPAILCMHDFAQLDRIKYPLYKKVYAKKYAPWQLAATRMSDAERKHFSQALSTHVPGVMPVAA